ncbi:9659_t:CDS:2 [Entrophospora sp. SA101]|nr:6637_t:CDS:2 [Entrophospora sp. SA101]CAJ0636518.1 9659_t:CDS:2 [Entrophospora sp. SA101]
MSSKRFHEGSKRKNIYDVEESDDEHEDSEDDEYSEDEDENDKNRQESNKNKINKKDFTNAFNNISNNCKMRLKSGKIVEDTLFEYAKNLEHEDDENVKKLFTKEEWDELTQENLEAFEIPDDILGYLKFYNQDTIEGDSPLSRTQYENWCSVNLFGSCLDFCFRDYKLGTDVKRTDSPSTASGNRKNRAKEKGARKRVGRKIDGIIYNIGKNLELGVFESASIFEDEHDNKYLKESFKLPKSMRDIYCGLARYIKYEEEKCNSSQVIGILHLGLMVQFSKLWRANGLIAIYKKSNNVNYLSPRFTKLGLNDYLKLLAKIYSYKLLKQQITENNLRILGLCDPIEESDLLEELKNIDLQPKKDQKTKRTSFLERLKSAKK